MAIDENNRNQVNAIKSQFYGVLDAALDGIILIDSNGCIEIFNHAAENIFGYHASEVLGGNVNRLMPEPFHKEHDSYIQNHIRTGEKKVIGIGREVLGKRKNGEIFPMELAVGQVKDQTPLRYVGLVRDISERQKMRDNLAALNEEFRLVFENAPAGVFITDIEAVVTNANRWLKEFLSPFDSPILGSSIFSYIHEEDVEEFKRIYAEIATHPSHKIDMNLRIVMPNDIVKNIHVYASFVGASDRAQTVIGLIVDRDAEIIEIIGAQEVREKLAHADRLTALGEMASTVAHEINQPLAAIAAYAQACSRLIDTDPDNIHEIKEVLDRIHHQAQRGGEVVTKIRGFAGQSSGALEVCDINQLINNVCELSTIYAGGSQVKIETEFAENLPKVRVEPIQIQQVCLNLINNGIDAMDGLPLSMKVLNIRTKLHAKGGVVVMVDDTGAGVSSEILEELFESFKSSKKNGLGLGLSISKKIVDAHGGRLYYEALPGAGSRFIFDLPAFSN